MTILIIYTGGTIGMVPSDGGWRPQPGYLEGRIREHLRQMDFPHKVHWREYDPLIDSSQLRCEHWNELGRDIIEYYDDYDGFVVLHGTDTMAYTSSALAFMLRGTRKPVVLTGSQIPVWEEHTDGLDNVMLALETAARDDLQDVYLTFDSKLYHGAHVTKINTDRLKAFAAPHGVQLQADLEAPESPPRLIPVTEAAIEVYHYLPGTPLAGLKALIETRPRVLILLTYGSGNAPDTQELRDLLGYAADQGTLLINRSQCYRANVDMDRYEAAAALREGGLIGAGTMTLEALVGKLHVLLTLFDDNIDLAQQTLLPWSAELPKPKM
ncbi:asparaginase [Natronospirillum operosum]|uniref:Asparaginase n=1 Tax=Natronospirillum operosum TaxID=2759953 RepID=A0A4Z0WE36_9GAMM|nr:asparaginase [Natronospirillum operosum]TGG95280.1 asparaginase [Natronospirillum operosum]